MLSLPDPASPPSVPAKLASSTPRRESASGQSINFASDRSPLQKLELELKYISQEDATAEGVARRLSRRYERPQIQPPEPRDGRSRQSASADRWQHNMPSIPANDNRDDDKPNDKSRRQGDGPSGHSARELLHHYNPFHGHGRRRLFRRSRESLKDDDDKPPATPSGDKFKTAEIAHLTLEDNILPATEESQDAPAYPGVVPPRKDPAPKTSSPPLSIKCGPLLRYLGLRRDGAGATTTADERETWRGTIMVVTEDEKSTYSLLPTARLFFVQGNVESPDARIDGERAGKYREIHAMKLHAERGVTFWRFNVEVELGGSESRVAYRINEGPLNSFWVPARGQTMNIMFYSCNGFSLSVNPEDFCGPDPLWKDVLEKHKRKPFHVMLGGGDQIYNDIIGKTTEHFQNWLNIKTPFQKSAHEFTNEMEEELEESYLQRYCHWFAQGTFAIAGAQIPMVNIWDDHDIIDGYGSYPSHFNRCEVFTGLGRVAFRYYMLFQHQSTIEEKEEHENSWILGAEPGPYITELSRNTFMFLGRNIAFLGLDCRTERTRDIVVSASTYERVFARLRKEIVPGETTHLIVLLGIPMAYPRLVWLENLLTSRLMDPIKALSRMGLFGGFINNFDGGVELLDDLDDHWTARNHKQERNFFVKRLQSLARETSVRVTILGGDVHLAGIGQFMSNPKLDVSKIHDHRYMPNIISSAIVNTPPPNAMADILNKRNKVHHLDENTDENMFPIFTTDVNGTPRNNRRLMPRRNYCIIEAHDPNNPSAALLNTKPKRSTFSKLRKSTFKKPQRNHSTMSLQHGDPYSRTLESTEQLGYGDLIQDALQVTLQVEVNQKDPTGVTKPYGFVVPALRNSERERVASMARSI